MTSLSNYPQSERRVIQIKEVKPVRNLRSPEQETIQNDMEDRRHSLHQEVMELEARKQKLREETASEIEAVKQAWEEERKALENEAFRKGFDEGTNKGHEEAAQAFESRIQQANQIVEQAGEVLKEKVKESERVVLDLALTCAGKIMKTELSQQPEAYLALVRGAIEEVQMQPEIVIYVHPDQYAVLQGQREELHEAVRHTTDLSIYAKGELPPFTCRVESPFGIIDAGIDTQLTELRKAVMKAAERTSVDE
ncbi:flagellar assembly protein FliH [Halobacillus litoralis]|nr:flagellar assembly protein FliH [Halobacillus litoralis]